jgi:class 3 adenylate cyclase
VLIYYAGISAGEVIAGLLRVDQLTYGVFGDPARAALALNAVAGPGQILVGADTAAELGGEWEFEQASDLLDLRGEPVVAKALKGGPM